MLAHWYTLLLARLGVGPDPLAPREVVRLDSPICMAIELDSAICPAITLSSTLDLETPA